MARALGTTLFNFFIHRLASGHRCLLDVLPRVLRPEAPRTDRSHRCNRVTIHSCSQPSSSIYHICLDSTGRTHRHFPPK
ncbi:hypothetical protein FA13DRAFT_989979 [Coprinellus micaceus]|uniref:Uncharacterized protein n=1 Tax=Coprinellus micaceus TaxID=71717 RepID=A0A4Y7RRK2_COPMI|nr:hypothetical protein FA13DRAFT_989979 [Coprinellus micaceus]